MGDIISILQASHSTAAVSVPSNTKYVAVDPKLYQGTWSGTYANKKTFTIRVSDVTGFRAQVKYQSSDGTVKNQSVLIKDGSFRVGDTKFYLATAATPALAAQPATAATATTAATDAISATPAKAATAIIKTASTDPVTGSTFLDTATATQS